MLREVAKGIATRAQRAIMIDAGLGDEPISDLRLEAEGGRVRRLSAAGVAYRHQGWYAALVAAA
jgi:hypothetical protein